MESIVAPMGELPVTVDESDMSDTDCAEKNTGKFDVPAACEELGMHDDEEDPTTTRCRQFCGICTKVAHPTWTVRALIILACPCS